MQGRNELSLKGIYPLHSFIKEVYDFHAGTLDNGASPGWKRFGYHYRVVRGMMTIVTGIPASGKSEFLDAMFVNLATEGGWKFAYYSPENFPLYLHAVKLAEKYMGQAFKDPLLPDRAMTKGQVKEAMERIEDHFTWLYPEEEEAITVDTILAKALTIHKMTGIDGLLIDPWNEIEVDPSMTEAQFISASLTKIRRWARQHNIHVWIVVHPRNLMKNKSGTYDPPTPYEINGGAMWRNKADFMLCVHRPNLTKPEVEVYIQKVKFKHLGNVGKVEFDYHKTSGTYTEIAR